MTVITGISQMSTRVAIWASKVSNPCDCRHFHVTNENQINNLSIQGLKSMWLSSPPLHARDHQSSNLSIENFKPLRLLSLQFHKWAPDQQSEHPGFPIRLTVITSTSQMNTRVAIRASKVSNPCDCHHLHVTNGHQSSNLSIQGFKSMWLSSPPSHKWAPD